MNRRRFLTRLSCLFVTAALGAAGKEPYGVTP